MTDEEYEDTCRAITCSNKAVLALVLSHPIGEDGQVITQRIPYCDNDAGWFFRAMTSYGYFGHIGLEVLENPFGEWVDTALPSV